MAIGDIGSVLDIDEFDPDDGNNISVLQVADGIVAVFYRATGFVGAVKTYPVAEDGTFGTIIDSWVFETPANYWGWAVEISTGIFMVVYRPPNGFIKAATIAIASDGIITHAFIDSVANVAATTYGIYGVAKKTGVNVAVAVWYEAPPYEGHINTFTCDSDGTNIVAADTWQFAGRAYLSKIEYISEDIFALVYSGVTDVLIATVAVDDSGIITESLIDTQELEPEFLTTNWGAPCRLMDDLVAIGYASEAGSNGYIATYTIDGEGNISAQLNRILFDGLTVTSGAVYSLGTYGGQAYFFVWYNEASGDDNVLRTFSCDSEGTISGQIDWLKVVENIAGSANGVAQVRDGIWVFGTSSSPGADGYIDSVDIEMPLEPSPGGGNQADVLVKNAFI